MRSCSNTHKVQARGNTGVGVGEKNVSGKENEVFIRALLALSKNVECFGNSRLEITADNAGEKEKESYFRTFHVNSSKTKNNAWKTTSFGNSIKPIDKVYEIQVAGVYLSYLS